MKHYKKQSSFRNSLRMKLCFLFILPGASFWETNEKLDGGIVKFITQTSHIKNGIRTLKNQYFSL